MLAQKNFARAYDYFGDEVKAQFPVEGLPQLWDSVRGQYGEFVAQREVIRAKIDKGEKVATICEFEKNKLAISIAFDSKGKVQGLFFEDPKIYDETAPQYTTPEYADPASFTEREVSVGGGGEWALPATLTMPKGAAKSVSAVVLVHGSGAHDRDETHFNRANKVFKDLSWGLASRGIAVLRYEKRNKQYPKEFARIKSPTVNEETVDDALAAVRLLRQTPGIDTKNIYVLGHSLGGMMIPRIGAGDEKLAGLIVFAGTARPLEDTIWEQFNFLALMDGTVSPEEQELLNRAKQDVADIKSLKPETARLDRPLLGFPSTYWADWKAYNPPSEAKKLKQRMLILQGENDYQVTMKDFQLWKDSLSGSGKPVSFRSYPKLNHLFMPGAGEKPNPQDYEQPNHVDRKVIDDIEAWILKKI